MAQRTDSIQQSIEETRQDIEQKRSAMTEKLEILEERVRETVEGAKSTVEDIIDNVKGTVDETVGAVKGTVDEAKSTVEGIVENVKDTMDDTVTVVKRSFDLRYQVEQRPWLMVGSAVFVGYMLGGLGSRRPSGPRLSYAEENRSYGTDTTSGTGLYSMTGGSSPEAQPSYTQPSDTQPSYTPPSYARPERRGWWSSNVLGQFREEFDIIKGAMVTALMNNLRDILKQNMPSIAPQLEKAVNSATAKLGAQPLNRSEQHPQTTPGHSADRGPRNAETGQEHSDGPKSTEERKSRYVTV